MKVELHLHTSRYSVCAENSPRELMTQCMYCGYKAVYITEHDAIWSVWEIDELQSEFPWIKIFSGVELTISYKPLRHLVVLGTNDPQYLEFGDDPAAALAKARREGHLTILAHPFRWENAETVIDPQNLPDALEYVTCNQTLPGQLHEVELSADRFKLATVNTGDVHSLDFINRYWIETNRAVESALDIRKIVMEGAYQNVVAEDMGQPGSAN